MGRLPGFDYSRPFFYMVTIKAREGLACGRIFPKSRKIIAI